MSSSKKAFASASWIVWLTFSGTIASSQVQANQLKPAQIAISYKATLAGVYVGKATLQIALTHQAYNISGSGLAIGVLKNLYGFKLDVKSFGGLSQQTMIPQSYTTQYGTEKSSRSIKIKYSRNGKAKASANPPFFPGRSRVPLKSVHLKNTLDPLSALFLPVKKNVSATSPENCRRVMPVFDGRIRYNLKIDSVKSQKQLKKSIPGYNGPILVCKIKFQPVAGHYVGKQPKKKLKKNEEMEVWLAPTGSAGLLVPIKGRMPTPLGTAEIVARRIYLDGQKVAAL